MNQLVVSVSEENESQSKLTAEILETLDSG